jgi:hypothetical protein
MKVRVLPLLLILPLILANACVSKGSADTLAGSDAVAPATPKADRPLLIAGTNGLAFGLTSVGVAVNLPLTIINAGSDVAVVSPLTISASLGPSSAISLSSDTCSGQTLIIGQSCTVTVNFSPSATGGFSGFVSASYLGGVTSTSSYSLPIAYTGFSSLAQPVVASAPASWDFGTLATAATSSKTLTISNSSTGNAIFQAATITGSGYTITSDNCNTQTLTSSTTCTITIQFSPLFPGSSLGVLTLNYQNLSGSPGIKTVPLSAIGNVPQPVLTLSPNPQNFNNVATNSYATQVISIANNTSVSATIGTATVSGSGYTIVGNTCNSIVLGASANCSVTVRFTPGSLGAVAGTLTVPFTSAQGIAYTTTDNLAGTGVAPTVAFFFNGFTGVPATDSTGLTSTGVTLQWSAQTAASYYKVTQTGGGTGTIASGHLFPTSVATYNIGGLTPNTAYQFKVNAYDVNDTSDGNNNWVTITTPNINGSTFKGWSDVVATGSVFTDIGAVDNSLGNTGTNRLERNLSMVYGFDNTMVDTTAFQITVGSTLVTGSALKFNTDGTAPTGLAIGTIYYAINSSATQIKLASTYANALAGNAIPITSVGSGNMTLMPRGVVKLGWELFSFTPAATATSYNIYRSTSLGGAYSIVGTSTSNAFFDNQVSDQTTYYYKIEPVISGTEVTSPATADSIITIYVPPQNMALVHRWVANRETCTNLLGFSWPAGINRNDNYSCAYTWGSGYGPNTTYSKAKWDIGYSLAIDRWQSGCKMKSYGSAAPAGGSTNDVYLIQGAATTSSGGGHRPW